MRDRTARGDKYVRILEPRLNLYLYQISIKFVIQNKIKKKQYITILLLINQHNVETAK